jgi:formylglycine-generating enzyme required for sulfatase activity
MATLLSGESNWVDWVQVPVSNAVTVHQVFDPNPPPGMALIPAGSFLMGTMTILDHEGNSDELPKHPVRVSGFYMDRTEVTQALWDEVRTWGLTNGYTDLPVGGGKATSHPVHSVNWYATIKWCNARSEKENLTPVYCTGPSLTTVYKTGNLNIVNDAVRWSANGHRLPTEAEWEKAARGGLSGKRFPWGDVITHSEANYYSSASAIDTSPTQGYHPDYDEGGYPYTNPVANLGPNTYGLYGMSGNSLEWCWDWYLSDYYGSSPGSNPRGPTSGSARVLRGGSWDQRAFNCRTAYRAFLSPVGSINLAGFRCVRAAGW